MHAANWKTKIKHMSMFCEKKAAGSNLSMSDECKKEKTLNSHYF